MTKPFAKRPSFTAIARALVSGAALAVAPMSQAAIGWASPTPTAPPVTARPPYAGLPNFGSDTPHYRWGWFGAEHPTRPSYWHYDHMGRSMKWQYR